MTTNSADFKPAFPSRLLIALAIALSVSNPALASLDPIEKFKLKANQNIYEGFVNSKKVHLYRAGTDGRTATFDLDEVIFSTKVSVNGVKGGQRILLRTQASPIIDCFVTEVFADGEINAFCDEVIKALGHEFPTRLFYRVNHEQVIKEESAVGSFKLNDVYSLNRDTKLFESGKKVRIIHVYKNNMAFVEPAYRQHLNKFLPENRELISLEDLSPIAE